MLKALIVSIAFTAASSAFAADPVQEVRLTEIAFAKAFADHDAAKFASFILDDSVFLGGRAARGKQAIMERWGRWIALPRAPFSWEPERVIVNGAGTIGLSTGPVYDDEGHVTGNFSSIWLKQPDGAWKILFDGGGPSPACLLDNATQVEEGFVNAKDGARLHYRKLGSGLATVIIPLDALLFEDFRQLADIATVITYDLRNRGRSQHLSDLTRVSLQHDVDDMEAVRDALNVDKFIPIGFSYLGKAVALYAAAHPDRVIGVVQLGPIQLDPAKQYERLSPEGSGVIEEDWTKLQRLRKSPAAVGGRELCEAELAVQRYMLVGDPANAFRVRSACNLQNEWPANLTPHFERIMSTGSETTPAKDLPAKISVPVLTIHGTKDRLAPFAGGRDWVIALPNARLVTVTGAGHASWLDQPAVVFAAIRSFIRSAGTKNFEWPLSAEQVR